ncbi:MAG: winged helix-turn-helix domain-containing protein [Pseudomonadota bacterium]
MGRSDASQGTTAGMVDESGTTGTPARRRGRARRTTPVELDRVIHERVRLAIVSALASAQSLTFSELRDLLGITDGNLSVHARRLEEAGFIVCEKSFVDRVPRTEYQLSESGRKALDDYLGHMESLIRQVRKR